jgi:SAM-dependent methyltransferase
MSEDHYIARHSAEAFERERLGLLERLADPITLRRLQSLGVREGWRCLEIGAGHGSVARWLAKQVGPTGQVVATDLNPLFLRELAEPNIVVRQHDILSDELEDAHYDLVHCRFLLMHLSQPQRAAERMAKAVRRGGWLCLEESDYTAARAADPSHPLAMHFTTKMRVAFDALQTGGTMDPYFGCGMRGLMEGLGFVEVGHEGVTWINRGGEIGARFLQMGFALGRQTWIATGVLTEKDYAALERSYQDPSFTFVDQTLFGAWGRRLQDTAAQLRTGLAATNDPKSK